MSTQKAKKCYKILHGMPLNARGTVFCKKISRACCTKATKCDFKICHIDELIFETNDAIIYVYII